MEKKLQIPSEILCFGLPDEIVRYLNYCKSLKFEDRPDYDFLRGLFTSLLGQCSLKYGITGDFLNFDWTFENPDIIWDKYNKINNNNNNNNSKANGSNTNLNNLISNDSNEKEEKNNKSKLSQIKEDNENNSISNNKESFIKKQTNDNFEKTNENNPNNNNDNDSSENDENEDEESDRESSSDTIKMDFNGEDIVKNVDRNELRNLNTNKLEDIDNYLKKIVKMKTEDLQGNNNEDGNNIVIIIMIIFLDLNLKIMKVIIIIKIIKITII